MDTLENVMKMDNIKTRHVMLKQVQEKNGPAIVFAPKNCKSWLQMEESSTCCKHSQPENTEPVALKGSIAPSMCHEDGNIESLPHLLLTDLGFNQPFRSQYQKIAPGMSLLESIKVFF